MPMTLWDILGKIVLRNVINLSPENKNIKHTIMKHTSYSNILAAIVLLFFVSSCNNSANETAEVYSTVHDLNELQLASATVTKIYTVRDPYYQDQENAAANLDLIDRLQRTLHVMEHTIKIGDRVGVYGLQCTYTAFIDLSKMSPDDIKIEKINGIKHVSITLPPVQVKALGNDFQTKIYHERHSGLRSGITESERTIMRKQASDQLNTELGKERSQDLDALKKAGEDKAVDFFSTMLQNLGYSPKITIKK